MFVLGTSSSAFSFHASLLQAIDGGVISRAFQQVVSQTPQHFRQIFQAASQLWELLCPPERVYLLGQIMWQVSDLVLFQSISSKCHTILDTEFNMASFLSVASRNVTVIWLPVSVFFHSAANKYSLLNSVLNVLRHALSKKQRWSVLQYLNSNRTL